VNVVDPEGAAIGSVVQWEENGGGILLTVKRPNGKRFDLPFVSEICTGIDIEQRRIVADLPEGLIEIDRLPAIEEMPGLESSGEESGSGAAPETDAPGNSESAAPEIGEASPAITFDLVTIFPDMFGPLLAEGILSRAIRAGTIEVKVWDLREFATDRHQSTDDEAYGGGAGMVMLAEPVLRCVDAIRELRGSPHVVMMSPQGRRFAQSDVRELAGRRSIVLLCGRYEGFDERVREAVVAEELSIGDFVVTGGELPAMLVVDAVSRMIEGVVGQRNSVEADSFYTGLLDYPHYTRPAEVRGMRVPEVLISGHFEKIRQWRKEQSLRSTLAKRPDLLETADLDAEAERMLERIRRESSEEVVDSE
jgi:tRNA (guanine37-N1)-methyltransferase